MRCWSVSFNSRLWVQVLIKGRICPVEMTLRNDSLTNDVPGDKQANRKIIFVHERMSWSWVYELLFNLSSVFPKGGFPATAKQDAIFEFVWNGSFVHFLWCVWQKLFRQGWTGAAKREKGHILRVYCSVYFICPLADCLVQIRIRIWPSKILWQMFSITD